MDIEATICLLNNIKILVALYSIAVIKQKSFTNNLRYTVEFT